MDQNYSRGSRSTNSHVIKSLGSIMKNLWVEEHKVRDSKSLSSPQSSNRSSEKAQKEMKKEKCQKNQECQYYI